MGEATGKVSVVLPVFNAEPWLRRAMASVTDQTYEDLELLVVDDRSTDGSWELLRSLAAGDHRVVPLRTPANSGPAYARNVGMDHASGEFLTFIDADDAWHPRRLERLVEALQRNPDVSVVADEVRWFLPADDGGLTPFRIGNRIARARRGRVVRVPASSWISTGVTLKPLLRRELIEEPPLRQRVDLIFPEDYVFFVEALDRSGGPLVVVREPLYLYTLREGSVRSRADNREQLSRALSVLEGEDALGPSTRKAVNARRRRFERELAIGVLLGAWRARRFREVAESPVIRDPMSLLYVARMALQSGRYRLFRMRRAAGRR